MEKKVYKLKRKSTGKEYEFKRKSQEPISPHRFFVKKEEKKS